MNAFVELGVPVKGINWVRLHPGQTADGRPSLLASMGQNNGGLFVLDIDLATGHCRQFPVGLVGADYPSASMRSLRTGALYVGSAWSGHLHRFDPAHSGRGLEDLGAVDPELATFPTGIQEAPDGSIWIGAYPGACLTRFDPGSGRFTRHGRMDPVEKYLYPLCGDDGTVVTQVKMIRYRLEAIDPRTGEHRAVGPALDEPTNPSRRFIFFKGTDGLLYLECDQVNFRLAGFAAIPVDRVPPQMPGIHSTIKHGYQEPVLMPGGLRAALTDEEAGIFRTLRLTSANSAVPTREVTLDWQGGGTKIFLIHLGPDRRIYGSSYMPEHLFRCELDGTGMTDLGQCSLSLGDAHSMINYGDGLMAIASYPAARVSLYDPRQPFRFGLGPGSNPLDLGSLDDGEIAYRPHTMATSPDGRIWIGSVPNYGLRSGPLACYDPKTGHRKTHRELVPDASPNCMLWLPALNQMLIGLGTEEGSGVQVKRDAGAFVLWDTERDQLAYAGDFGVANLADVVSLAPADRDGLVYALSARPAYLVVDFGAKPAPTQLLLLNPARRAVVARSPVPPEAGPLPVFSYDILRTGDDGAIYLVLATGVFRVTPGTCELTPVWKMPADTIDSAGPLVGRRLFFATGWNLRCVDI